MTDTYRAPNAPGFGAYQPRRPAPAQRQRSRRSEARNVGVPQRYAPPVPRRPHRAWRVVLNEIERRLRRLTAILAPGPDRPAHARWRARLLERHGRESYEREAREAQRHARICRRAIRERWAQVPPAADRALRAYETAPTLPAKWAALAELKGALFQ